MENIESKLRFIDNAISSDLPQLVDILIETESDIVRNAAALAISDLEGNSYLPKIIEVINRESVISKGTLIYALSMMKSENYFVNVAPFILSENLEIYLEAISFIRQFKSKASLEALHWMKKLVTENKSNFLMGKERQNLLRSLNYEISKRKTPPFSPSVTTGPSLR